MTKADRCLTCWEHGSPFDGPCPHCGYNGTVEKVGPSLTRTGRGSMTETKTVEVTQADRDAAWPHRPSCYKDDPVTGHNWRTGVYDKLSVVQAFARHRLASQSLSTDEEVASALSPAMMLESVESGVWSLQFRFGTGDEACKSMRHAADAVRKLKERSCPITAKNAASSGTDASATTDEEVRRLREALEVGEHFLNKCNSAWAAGEPPHRVKAMLDAADEFRAALQPKDTPSHGG